MERNELTLIEPENGTAVSIPVQQKAALTNAASLAADVAKIVRENGLSKSFKAGAKEHVFVEGWLTISRVNNEAPHAKVEAVEQHGEHEVIKARAWITDAHGNVVSEADGYCSSQEGNWKDKPFYARASMAQTRAIGKAMRLRHAWVMVMAGFSPTPAEEMDGVQDEAPKKETPAKVSTRKLKPEESKLHPPGEGTDGPAYGLTAVEVLKMSSKTGTKKDGTPWELFGINVKEMEGGATYWVNTFSKTHHDLCAEAYSSKVSIGIKYEQGDKGKNLTYVSGEEAASE